MNQADLQRDIRSAISITYELLRHEHILKREKIARALGDLESELARVEAKLGGPRRAEIVPTSLDRWADRIDAIADGADPVVTAQLRALVASVRGIGRDLASFAARPERAAPIARRLRRAIPQSARALLDDPAGLGAVASVALARTTRARLVGAAAVALGAITDVRRAEARATPFTADRVVGAALAAAPFVLGYARRDPAAAAVHVLLGVAAVGAGALGRRPAEPASRSSQPPRSGTMAS